MRKAAVILLAAGVALAACSTDEKTAKGAVTDPTASLRSAVEAYSAAYLGDQPEAAFDLLSARCKGRVPLEQMRVLTSGAKRLYGSAAMTSFTATVSGDLGRATYTFIDASINQTDQPWAREQGRWRYDAC